MESVATVLSLSSYFEGKALVGHSQRSVTYEIRRDKANHFSGKTILAKD